MNLHGLRILDFKTSRSKTATDSAVRKEPKVLLCENEGKNKKTSDNRDAEVQNGSGKTHKVSSRKYCFLQRRTSSEIFRNSLQTKVNDQSFKNISCEDLKANYKDEKVNQHSRFNFFNKDSILNLHLKGGDVRRNKKRNKQEYDTKVLFDNVPRINTSSKKPVKNESMKQRKPNILLDDTFGFLKNNRSVTSCYRQNNNFINLDQYLLSLKKIKKRKAKKNRVPSVFGGRSRRKKKVITQCTCEHNPVKILSSLPNSTVKSAGYYNINPSNKHISEGNLGRKSNQVFKTRPVYIAPENKTAFRNQKLSKVTSTFKKKITKRNGSVTECKCPPNNYWEKQLESKRQLKKDALVSVSSLSLDPKIYCVCDAAVGTDKSKLATRKRSKTEYKCCQMKRNTPRLVAESWKQNEHPHSYNFNTIKKDRPKGLVKEEHNTFCTDFISDFVDFRVGQTKHRFSVQCMKYIFLGLLVIVWSPCLVALFLGRVIMCPQRMSCLLGGPQLLKQMQTNSNCTRNVKSKRSLNKSCRTEVPISTPINYINCLPAACINTNLPTHTSEKEFKKCQDKSLPVECQRIKMSTHSVSNKTKRKCLVTGNERPQGSSNILMNYLKNKCPISEYPRPQKLIHVKNQRQKKFMSSVASWCTRAVASFSNVVSVFKLIGFRIPSGTRASFIPSANASQRNRCSLYYSKGREWIVKPQIIQNMRCEYSPDLCLSTSSKDCILKPKCKVSFSEQQECPEDCILKHSTRKADPDSHFSTALFGNDHTSTKQQFPACSTSHFQAKILSEKPVMCPASSSFSKIIKPNSISLRGVDDSSSSTDIKLSTQNTNKNLTTPVSGIRCIKDPVKCTCPKKKRSKCSKTCIKRQKKIKRLRKKACKKLCEHRKKEGKKRKKKERKKCLAHRKKILKERKRKRKLLLKKKRREEKIKRKKEKLIATRKRANRKKRKLAKKKRKKTYKERKGNIIKCCKELADMEKRTFPLDVQCGRLYIHTLKRTPCFWIYKRYPSLYPSFLKFYRCETNLMRFCTLCLSTIICCPIVYCSYYCCESCLCAC